MTDGLQVGLGKHKGENPQEAGKNAAEQAAETVSAPQIVFVFSGSQHADTDMLGAIQDVFPDATIVGCSTAGEQCELSVGTGSVVLLAVEADDLIVSSGVGTGISKDEFAAGVQAAENALEGIGDDQQVLRSLEHGSDGWQAKSPLTFTILSTTLQGDAARVMDGIQDVLGDAAYATGGLAGDDWQMKQTHVYHNGDVLTDALVIAAMKTDHIISHGVRHGRKKVGEPYTITKAEGNVVHELNGRPPADIYEELYDEAGKTPQFILNKPLGIEVGEPELRLRAPQAINDDGSIVFAAGVPEGHLAYITESPNQSIIEAAAQAVEDALADAGDADPEDVKGVIIHNCATRWACLEDDSTRKEELTGIKDIVGEDTPVIGWYTYGEIALPAALDGVHNQTLVIQLFIESN